MTLVFSFKKQRANEEKGGKMHDQEPNRCTDTTVACAAWAVGALGVWFLRREVLGGHPGKNGDQEVTTIS